MKIKTNQLFRHDTKTYQPDRTYTVDDELGVYFVTNGWATSDEVPSAGVALQVDDSTLGHNSKVN